MSHLIKTTDEIERIRESGRILAKALRRLRSVAVPGVSLMDLDSLAKRIITENGGTPAFLGYRPEGARTKYPFTLCASVNNVIVHGRPSPYRLKSGDVLKLD
ncbi:MAG: methionyl aminopeptidase, partial [Candidatus Colwellbacteria bacterium]|nr:methionyl aminopeptidase [Candidatus Colwellbacteria bacterium]